MQTPQASRRAEDAAGYSYLIIAGTTKGATTSLFQYLGDHPRVCLANIKETRFFLEKGSPLPAKFHCEDGLDRYGEFFPHCGGDHQRLRVDATPDYLYSPQAAQNIFALLPHSKIIFALREPISRVLSWYRFAKQNNSLAESVTLDEYVRKQFNAEFPEQHMRAVAQGRYAQYLKPYYDRFGADRIFVTFLEELQEDPQNVMERLCLFAEIDPAPYARYAFHVFNRTENVRSPQIHQAYRGTRRALINAFHDNTTIRVFLRKVRKFIEPFYMSLNRKSAAEHALFAPEVLAALKEYYRAPNDDLAKLLGRHLPW
jgi:hypothetical protein